MKKIFKNIKKIFKYITYKINSFFFFITDIDCKKGCHFECTIERLYSITINLGISSFVFALLTLAYLSNIICILWLILTIFSSYCFYSMIKNLKIFLKNNLDKDYF